MEPEQTPPPARSRTGASRRVSNALIGPLLAIVGFAIVVQVRSNTTDEQLVTARPEDLVRILSDLDARQERLRTELATLEDSKRQLESGAQTKEAALAAARERADELGILAGTLPAEGRGLEITIKPGGKPITASMVLDAIEELRGAGAEAMQITGANGKSVRVVAVTYFVDDDSGLDIDGSILTGSYTITAIGAPQTLRSAMNIPGGVVDSVRQLEGNVEIHEPVVVRVTAIRPAGRPKYARPVS